MAKKLSKFFTIEELTRTNPEIFKRYGVKNDLPERLLPNVQALIKNILDPLREKIGKPLHITSGYRSPEYNKIIGGSINSQHMNGEAADIDGDVTGVSNKLIFETLKTLPFDQLIWEFGGDEPDWVHVSYSKKNRGNILRAYRKNGVVKYEKF